MRDSEFQTHIPKDAGSAGITNEGVIIADMELKVIALNEAAQAALRDLTVQTNRPDAVFSLPDELVKQLKTRRNDGLSSSVFSVTGRNGEYNCRAFVLKGGDIGATASVVTLYIKKEVSVTEAVRQVGTYYNLTSREQEALMGISMGLTSKQLAKRMSISPNTVKAFLRFIMIKMGAATRAGVVGKLLEQNGPMGRQPDINREV
jgi:DNA-binding CsgD family transcriptional regulator